MWSFHTDIFKGNNLKIQNCLLKSPEPDLRMSEIIRDIETAKETTLSDTDKKN